MAQSVAAWQNESAVLVPSDALGDIWVALESAIDEQMTPARDAEQRLLWNPGCGIRAVGS